LEQKLLHLRSYEDVLSNCTQHDLGKISRELKEEDKERQLRDYMAKRDQSGYKTTDAKSFSPLVAIHTTDPPGETHSLDENRLNVSWNWPTTDEQMLKCKVFSDLWHKGYYLTSGLKYGGDYLAYPDDPIACHSHYIVKIFSWRENFSPLCLIQHGRLGNNVKKNILFCSAKPDGILKYYTLHWSGF
jgi:tRNA-splicing endonuclease subunit Sen34